MKRNIIIMAVVVAVMLLVVALLIVTPSQAMSYPDGFPVDLFPDVSPGSIVTLDDFPHYYVLNSDYDVYGYQYPNRFVLPSGSKSTYLNTSYIGQVFARLGFSYYIPGPFPAGTVLDFVVSGPGDMVSYKYDSNAGYTSSLAFTYSSSPLATSSLNNANNFVLYDQNGREIGYLPYGQQSLTLTLDYDVTGVFATLQRNLKSVET